MIAVVARVTIVSNVVNQFGSGNEVESYSDLVLKLVAKASSVAFSH